MKHSGGSTAWVAPAVIAMFLGGCATDSVAGNGERVSERREEVGFVEVDSEGSLDVTVEPGKDFGIRLSLDSNLLPLVRTRVIGGKLRIDTRSPVETILEGPHVVVTMPALQRVDLAGSGKIHVAPFDHEGDVEVALTGSGKVEFLGTTPSLRAELSGSGAVELIGSGDEVTLVLSGSGALDGKNFVARAGALELSGSGNLLATVEETAGVSLSGSGTIDLYGRPVLTSLSRDGSGEVHVR
jgi:hypothetical protein